ncbi:hypothetical protein MATL_G00263860 [Megalops atlanticus]|uniref:Uncharacterized protein n=1 Tax=Megalops atlanticus TaxID=7932 RepID=A0A9D3P8I3_MEGAT|nr:hypothetical protein MATL_G00263860 [Megalops atlanticus]
MHKTSFSCIVILEMFCIVEFTEEQSVEVVPSTWLFGNSCYWPPFKPQAAVKAAMLQSVPPPDWRRYPCKMIKTFDTYAEARQYLSKAEHSDLQSDIDEGGKRKRRAKLHYEDDSWGSVAKRKTQRIAIEEGDSSGDEANGSRLHLPPPLLPPPPPQPQFGSFLAELEPAPPATANDTWPNTLECAGYPYWKDAFKTVLQCLEEVKGQVADLHRKVDLFLLQNSPTNHEEHEVQLPVRTMEELIIIEKKLQDDTFKKILSRKLSLIGGLDTKTTVWRVMAALLTNPLASQFN